MMVPQDGAKPLKPSVADQFSPAMV